MKRALALLALGAAAAACTPMSREDFTRAAARSAVRPVLAERMPIGTADRALDCVLDNASQDELLALASDSVTGPTASTVQNVTTIASRPETLNCLAAAGLQGASIGE